MEKRNKERREEEKEGITVLAKFVRVKFSAGV
jgi:hypothetical protein